MSKIIDDFVIEVLESAEEPWVELADEYLSKAKYANSQYDKFLEAVTEIMETLGIDRLRNRKHEDGAYKIVVLAAAAFVIEKGYDEDLDRRDLNKTQKAADQFMELLERLDDDDDEPDDFRDRGRSRRGRGRGRSRRDYDDDDDDRRPRRRGGRTRRAGLRDEFERTRSNDDDRRGIRDRRTGRTERRRHTERPAEGNRSMTALDYAIKRGLNKEQEPVEETPRHQRTAIEMPKTIEEINSAPIGENYVPTHRRKVEFVGEESTMPKRPEGSFATLEDFDISSWKEVPVSIPEDYVDLNIDLTDIEFIMSRPISGNVRHNQIYDPFSYQPYWAIADDGCRELKFRERDMNMDHQIIPDFRRIAHGPAPVVAPNVLNQLATGTRMSVIDIRADHARRLKEAEEKLAEEQKDLPEEVRETEVDVTPLDIDSRTVRLDETIVTDSIGMMVNRAYTQFAEVEEIVKGTPSIEVDGKLINLAYVAQDEQEVKAAKSLLAPFFRGYVHQKDSSNPLQVEHVGFYADILRSAAGRVPLAIWKRVDRYMTQYVNQLLGVNVGIKLRIESFVGDAPKLMEYLLEKYGEVAAKSFMHAHATNVESVSKLTTDVSKDDETLVSNGKFVYQVEAVAMVSVSPTTEETGMSSAEVNKEQTFAVTAERFRQLHNALQRFWKTSVTPFSGTVGMTRYIRFGDGSVFQISVDSTAAVSQRGNTVYLLTLVSE